MNQKHLQSLVDSLTKILTQLKKTPMKDDLLDVCEKYLGTDATPFDAAPDGLACAETVTTLLKKVYPDTPIILGTSSLYDFMRHPANGYVQIQTPEPEAVVISPTGYSKFGGHGHTGIVGLGGTIMSNSSKRGTFERNYTIDSWNAYFKDKMGFPVFYFKRVNK